MESAKEKLALLDHLLSILEKAGKLGLLVVAVGPGAVAYLWALWEKIPGSVAFVCGLYGIAGGLWLYTGLKTLQVQRSAEQVRADFDSWDKVNELTFAQIANLWSERRAWSSFNEAAYAHLRMLKEQAEAGKLVASKNGPHYFVESTATRGNLKAFALAFGERPKFLFKELR